MTDNQDKNEPTAEELIARGQAAARQAELQRIAEEANSFEANLRKQLRENGKVLGLNFAPNTSTDTMIKQLTEAREQILQDPPTAAEIAAPPSEHAARQKLRDENLKLIRIRISCGNPNKSGLPGEILTVHNDIVGTVKKYIPYNEAGDSYHVPYILLKMLKRKKYMRIVDPPKGSRALPTTKLVPEYSIEVLDQLTPAELKELAIAQGAAASADTE